MLFYFFAGLKLYGLKNYIAILLWGIFLVSCTNQEENSSSGTPDIKFLKTEFDFGTIQMGEKVTCDFVFENQGDGDLLINKVDSDCGCAIANYETKAIKPGEKSSITAVFDSNGLPGFQMKKITVFSNAGGPIELIISAVVDFELSNGFD
jgi:hypothetical protein